MLAIGVRWRRCALAALVATIAAGCAAVTPAPHPAPTPAAAPLAAYVLLVESPAHAAVPFARVIVAEGQACPQLRDERRALTMSKRRNPHGFTVDVCEAEIPFERAFAVGDSGVRLPTAHHRVNRVAVVGDTGCEPSKQSGCALDDPAWPFPAIARAAAAGKPDLVLHMGDYNYRGTPSSFEKTVDGKQVKTYYYDAGDGAAPAEECELKDPYYSQNSTGNPDADAWDAWWLDFFQPAAPLLAAAPWIVARGNHELCSHAGPGWLYFLGPSSDLPAGGGAQVSCPSQDGEGPPQPHLVFVEPQVIALDGLSVAVLDSANACDEMSNFVDRYRAQLAGIAARLPGRPERPTWLIGHRPIWGAEGTADGPPYACDNQPGTGTAQPYGVLNRTLQCALDAPTAAALLPKLDLLLAGHMHRFESLDFAQGSGRPRTLIIGNGGVLEDTDPPTGSFSQLVDGVSASGLAVEQFGFVTFTRDAAGAWRGAVTSVDPAAWNTLLPACGSEAAATAWLCVTGMP
ncbi:MAG TPA: metallophosphoesterase [Thermoanaerobaculia bacterium]|nr:metallophosphoesterase [Thermoanaerobaculia bacterium]